MKNLLKVSGIIALIAMIGFAVISCGGGDSLKPSGVPGVSGLPALTGEVTSVTTEEDALALFEAVGEDFAEFDFETLGESFVDALLEALGNVPGFDDILEMINGEEEENELLASVRSARGITTTGSSIDADNFKGTIKLSFTALEFGENSSINGTASLEASMNTNTNVVSGKGSIDITLDVAETVENSSLEGSGGVKGNANVSYSMTDNKLTVNIDFAAGLGLTIISNNKGMKVIADVRFKVNETIDLAEGPTEAQIDRMLNGITGSITIYNGTTNARIVTKTVKQLMEMFAEEE